MSARYRVVNSRAVGDLTTRDGPNVVRGDGGHGRRPAIEGRELDLERRAIAVDVHYGTDIARLQAFGGHRCEQHHAIMFLDHVDDSLPARVGRDQPRRLAAIHVSDILPRLKR